MSLPFRVLVALVSSACMGCPSEVQPRTTAQRPDAPATGPRFEVDVDAPARATAGRPSHARIKVRALSPWHMNLEYPATLRVHAPRGVEPTTDEPGEPTSDAPRVRAERLDSESAEFEWPFTPRHGGEARFEAQLQFAVCGAEECAPESVPIDFTVDVGCDTDAFC
ncbi:MAG TPA: hypothetical protein VFG69_06160 [Nannocystaceae bacterium]|nr:hypothetical protein [Nannocystaceae bacterium]